MSGSGFFNWFSLWERGGNEGHQGRDPCVTGRSGAHFDQQPLCQGGPQGHVLFEDKTGYDFANDSREFAERPYTLHCGLSNLEYEARQNAIFQPDGDPLVRNPNAGNHPAGGRGDVQLGIAPGGTGLPGLGRLTPPGPPYDPQGQQGSGTPPNPPVVQMHQAPDLQLGRAQIAVHPTGGER
jgi:hypothetical protein